MHYNPSVLEAFNSVEHSVCGIYSVTFLFSVLCVNFFILIVNYLVLSLAHTNLCKNTMTPPLSSLVVSNKELVNSSGISDCYLKGYTSTPSVKKDTSSFNSLSEENFHEWFRGLVDGEGCFMIVNRSKNSFVFRFDIYMHKDDFFSLKNYISSLRVCFNYLNKNLGLRFILFLILFCIIYSSIEFNTTYVDLIFGFTTAIVYTDFYNNKKTIIKENHGKSGVYRFVNLLNNNSYIGSSKNLGARFRQYFDLNRISIGSEKNRVISKA